MRGVEVRPEDQWTLIIGVYGSTIFSHQVEQPMKLGSFEECQAVVSRTEKECVLISSARAVDPRGKEHLMEYSRF